MKVLGKAAALAIAFAGSAVGFATIRSQNHKQQQKQVGVGRRRLPPPHVSPLFSATSDVKPSSAKSSSSNEPMKTDTVICGGGPAGLLSAIMLAQKFPDKKVKVFDRLTEPPSPTDETVWCDYARFYLLGLGGRGQTSLDKFGAWKDVEDVCVAVVGRKDWAPGQDDAVERIFSERKFTTQVLPRDKLVSALYKHVVDNYSEQVEVKFGYDIRPLDFGQENESDSVTVEVFRCQGEDEASLDCEIDSAQTISADLFIAADGTARTVANEIERIDVEQRKTMNPIQKLFAGKPFKVTRYVDDNQRVYKTVPIKLPSGWRPDLNYSARSQGGRATLDALPANDKGDYCGVLLVRSDDEFAKENADPKRFREYMDEYLPMFSKILDDDVIAQVAKKPPSFLPAFRFVGPRLNQGDHTIILGDCAHTVKPYFGMGANSALEDVKLFSDIIDETSDMKQAVREFSQRRAKDSEKLVRISRSLDRPGKLGTITFLIPIILDSIFNKIAPKLFAPNVISMLQRDDITFRQVARRKRLDRFVQLSIIGSVLTSFAFAGKFAINMLAKAVGKRSSTVAGGLVAGVIAIRLMQNIFKFFVPGMAAADVLAKSKTSITSKDTFGESPETSN